MKHFLKSKLTLMWALLICAVAQMNAQTWTWTGETVSGNSSYYMLNKNMNVWVRTGVAETSSNPSDAGLITLEGTSTFKLKNANGRYINWTGTSSLNANNNSGTAQTFTNSGDAYKIYYDGLSDYYLYLDNSSPKKLTKGTNKNSGSDLWQFITQAQMTAYNNYIAAWNKLNTLSELNPSMPKASEVSAALSAATNYNNAVDNTNNLNNLYTACFEAATKDNPLNVTMFIKNPGYEATTWDDGWTVTNFVKQNNGNMTANYAEMWSGDLTSGKISQTLRNLPVGTYQLSASTTGGFVGETSMYAMEEARKVVVPGIDGDPVQHPVVPFVVHDDAEGASVEIGFKRDNCQYWTAVDDWTLSYYPADEYEWVNGIRLDGSYLSKPAYTSTPADGVDPDHAADALMVITWRDNYSNDVKTPWALKAGATAEVWTDGAKVADVNLLSDFRSSHYTNGFGLYIPNFDETKTYTIKVPANVFGYTQAGHGNEAFEIQAVASPLKDGKYFVVVKGTGKHVSRGKGWGTQAILDYYGVPMMVQTAGLTVFKFLDSNAFLGSDPSDDWLFTDIQGSEAHKVRRYILVPGEGEHEGEFQFYAPSRDKYLSHVQNSIAGDTYDAVNEGGSADYFQFEALTRDEYAKHLKSIQDDEAMRVAERTGIVVANAAEYNAKVEALEATIKEDDVYKEENIIFPKTEDEKTTAATYFERHNDELACATAWEGTPRDLVGGDKVILTLRKGIYEMTCDAFQQAMELSTLQANQGFRGLTYMYVKEGSMMYKSQLKSITETDGEIPTNASEASDALDAGKYKNRVLFYVPADNTEVEFGVENPQRLGNDIDETAGSWVAFKNIQVVRFGDVVEANMKVTVGKYGTFLAPFAVNLPAGVSAYTVTGVVNGSSASLSEAGDGHTLPACTPVVIYNEGEEDVNMTYRDFDTREEVSDTEESEYLVGFYEDVPVGITGDGNSYVMQTKGGKQAFYQVEPGKTFNGSKNRCYLKTSGASSVKMITLGEDDDFTTAIEQLTEQTPAESVIYDLSGRRVAKAAKGIYIINGRKVIK